MKRNGAHQRQLLEKRTAKLNLKGPVGANLGNEGIESYSKQRKDKCYSVGKYQAGGRRRLV